MKLSTLFRADSKQKKALLFLLKFIFFYLVLNGVYYVYHKLVFPDTVWFTEVAALQSAEILKFLSEPLTLYYDTEYPRIYFMRDGSSIVTIYEGCNGVTLYIMFLSFMLAFFKTNYRLILWSIVGILFLNLANLGRIISLYFISLNQPHNLYFYHKYFFNFILFALVIGLWWLSIKKLNESRF